MTGVALTLSQILRLVGHLDDAPGADTPRERFRAFLAESATTVAAVRELVEASRAAEDSQHRRARQDLVNHCGRLIGFDVEFGPYTGGAAPAGFWCLDHGFWVVVEVLGETAPADAGPLAARLDALAAAGRIRDPERALALCVDVPGAAGLAGLAARLREGGGDARVRVASTDALLSIADVRQAFAPQTAELVRLFRTVGVSPDAEPEPDVPATPEPPPAAGAPARRRFVVVTRDRAGFFEHVKREFADGRTDVILDRRVQQRRQLGYSLRILELRRTPDRRTRPQVDEQVRRLGYGIVPAEEERRPPPPPPRPPRGAAP
jgi:hypothetical protein